MKLAGLLLILAVLSPAAPIPYWVQPCTRPAAAGCQTDDPQLAQWAIEAWQSASNGRLAFTRVTDEAAARIRIFWASAEQGLYGETREVEEDGRRVAEVFVLPAPLDLRGDRLLRDAVVYLTCLHESGHALGLPHTDAFADIMYSFQFGGDIDQYFARYRRKLTTRDDIRKNSGLSDDDRAHLIKAAALK